MVPGPGQRRDRSTGHRRLDAGEPHPVPPRRRATGAWHPCRSGPGCDETAENGGSALSITEASENKALAYGFLEYANVGDGVATRLEAGNFPATLADLTDEKFLAEESEYFGGQKINEVLSESATSVVPGWQYLPYQVYANSVFPDTAGQAYTGSTSLADGLNAWQKSIVSYGNEQGFTVSE